MIIASGIAVGCVILAIGICIWCVLGNVDELMKNAEKWEDGE